MKAAFPSLGWTGPALCGVLVGSLVLGMACKGPGTEADKPPPPASSEEDVLAGFRALLQAVTTCDQKAFLEAHTQKAQGALKALDQVVTPEALALVGQPPGPDAGLRFSCTVARLAGFLPDQAKPVEVSLNPRIGTARVIFLLRDHEYGFPMARQFGIWRSPFPGYLFLANEYKDWREAIMNALPDPNRMPDLVAVLDRIVEVLDPFQPDWREYPDLAPTRPGTI